MRGYLGDWIERQVAACKCVLDGSVDRTRCRGAVPVAERRISFGPHNFGHNLDCTGTRRVVQFWKWR